MNKIHKNITIITLSVFSVLTAAFCLSIIPSDTLALGGSGGYSSGGSSSSGSSGSGYYTATTGGSTSGTVSGTSYYTTTTGGNTSGTVSCSGSSCGGSNYYTTTTGGNTTGTVSCSGSSCQSTSYSAASCTSGSSCYVYTPPSCTSECSTVGQRRCWGNGYQTCYRASNGCLYWSATVACGPGETCINGSCVKTCTNQCSVINQRVCDGNGYKTCYKSSDGCLYWTSITQCGWNQTCVNGSCIDTCQNQCVLGQHECSGSSGRTCVQSGQCTIWGSWQNCDSRCYRCGDGRCECGETKSSCPQDCGYNQPTVNLDYYGSVSCGQNATLNWASTNATSCQASGSWSGSRAISGSEQVGNFTGSRTYTITCSGSGGSASDSVTITGAADYLKADAGPDKNVDAGQSVRLDGSVSGDYDSVSWSCSGGSLSSSSSLRPTFYTPSYSYDYDKTYTCTLTARNECGSDSDTMRVYVGQTTSDFDVSLIARPKSDCAPLRDVDLIATLSRYGGDTQNYTYYFDCENDGHWDRIITTSNTSYTALNLCHYQNVGSYTARVRVEARNRTAADTEIVRADQCGISSTGDLSITKTVSNLSLGTAYQGTVSANPLNIVGYRIAVTGIAGNSTNVMVTDAAPANITNIRDVRVDGVLVGGNLTSGISLGTITAGQTKTITYTATVANEASFVYGQTTLTNVAMAITDGKSANSSAAVVVTRRAIMGATAISTGFDNQAMAGFGLALAAALACLLWTIKTHIIDPKRDPRQLLRSKIAMIRAGKFNKPAKSFASH